MKNVFKPISHYKPECIVRECNDRIVQNGLALTPAQVMDMVNSGIPISNSNLKVLETYKTTDGDYSVPMEFRRGADMADMWQHRQDVIASSKQAVNNHIRSKALAAHHQQATSSVEPPKTE